jgi:hypothetical protein
LNLNFFIRETGKIGFGLKIKNQVSLPAKVSECSCSS